MRKLFFPLLITLLALPMIWPFLQKGFFWTHDIIYLTRIYAASNALADGQFPLRWISEFRYGEPLFNYYAPLPYYFGSLIHFLGFDFITTAKIIFILITLASGFFMYLLAKEFWGTWGGLVSALAYLYAPYRAVNLYIRGTLSEIFAFVWFPLIFWAYLKFSQTGKKNYLIWGSLAFAFLILTHNIMALIFTPFLLSWLIFLISKSRKKISLLSVAVSLVLGLGLSATYWLPALWEQNLVQTQKTLLTLENLVNQFVKIREFIQPNWDGFNITHEIGLPHLAFLILAIFTGFFLKLRQKRNSLVIFYLILLFFFSIFLQTIYSFQIWQFFSLLQFIQFPWRIAGVSIFFLSLLGGSSVQLIKREKIQSILVIIAVLVLILVQINYFKPPEIQSEVTDKIFIKLEDAYLPREYVPVGVKIDLPRKLTAPVTANDHQDLTVTNIIRHSNSYAFALDLKEQKEIVLPIYWFPGWKAFDDKKEISLKKQPKTGLILLSLTPDQHKIYLKLTNTPLRQFANSLSLASLFAIAVIFLIDRHKKS